MTIAPFPKEYPQFPGEIYPDRHYVTVDYFGGSHTFDCDPNFCDPQYNSWLSLAKIGADYLFKDTQGATILFSAEKSVVSMPSGRQNIFYGNGSRQNNYGFLILADANEFRAVNRTMNHCEVASAASCSIPTQQRFATLTARSSSGATLTNADGEDYKFEWITLTAKEARPPLGNSNYVSQISDIVARYLTRVTLPGNQSANLAVTYGPIDPTRDLHDDVRVVQLQRDGVTVDYTYFQFWPYGKFYETYDRPAESNELVGVAPTGDTTDQRQERHTERFGSLDGFCDSYPNDVSCNSQGVGSHSTPTVVSIPVYNYREGVPETPGWDETGAGSHIYELYTTASIDGSTIYASKVLKPYNIFGTARRRLLSITLPTTGALSSEYRFHHNFFDEVAMAIFPEKNAVGITKDPRGNILMIAEYSKPDPQQADAVTVTETVFIYPSHCPQGELARCNKPLTSTDPRGATTEYEYNDRGQIIRKTGPAPMPGAPRPVTRHEYTERTAYILDANGGLIAAGPPISLLTRTSQCLTSENCQGTADEVVTEYDYGPVPAPGAEYATNLLLRGIVVTAADASGQLQTLRTCYTYNYFGEKVSETSPRADLTSCQ